MKGGYKNHVSFNLLTRSERRFTNSDVSTYLCITNLVIVGLNVSKSYRGKSG